MPSSSLQQVDFVFGEGVSSSAVQVAIAKEDEQLGNGQRYCADDNNIQHIDHDLP
ncbi:hypothetical protein TIFTF001_027489 [Ficus carica]|uniref:Uncharacterized protein n=1 Tax=Ficus carica TaxID=3494 RepID=A0AA88DN45_FICCA|nr:hypothetical protein TIFTF001_027489 [Ficus carica]